MRPPHEIRREIIRLRDRNHLTYSTLCERARISRSELFAAFGMRAREDTLIKLDAFLNAPAKFHRRPRADTKLSFEMENLGREAWLEYRIRSPHPDYFKERSVDRQRFLYNAVTYECKIALKKKMLEHYQINMRMSDGQNYWQFKEACLRRVRREKAVRTGDRNAHYFSWPPPGSAPERVEHGADENGNPTGVVGGGSPAA